MFVPTNKDPASILGMTDFHSDHLRVSWMLWIPGFQIPRFPNSQISKFQDAAAGTAAGRTLRSQSDPFPNASRDQIRRKEPRALAATDSIASSWSAQEPVPARALGSLHVFDPWVRSERGLVGI